MKSSLYSHFHSHGLEGALDTGCRCELAKESQMKETLRLHPVCCPQISKGCYRGGSPAQKEAPRGKLPDLQEDEINSVAERSIYFSSYAVLGSQASNTFLCFLFVWVLFCFVLGFFFFYFATAPV